MTIRSNGPILILAWISGCLDALSFLGPGRVFIANMTGNTVLFGLGIAEGNWPAVLRSLVTLIGFSLGVISSTLLVVRNYEQPRLDWNSRTTLALLIEGCLLLVFALLWPLASMNALATNTLIAIAALTMGQQSAIVLSLGIPAISTTYISGTITTLMANLGRRLFLQAHEEPLIPPIRTAIEREHPARLAAVWLTYITAAIIGGYGELHYSHLAAFLPVLALAILIMMAVLFSRREHN